MKHLTIKFIAITSLMICSDSFAATAGLCKPSEETVFSCRDQKKMYEICVSNNLSPKTGYIQYRAAKSGKVEFEFPSQKLHPKGIFKLSLLSNGAKLSFRNGEFLYELVEPVVGTSEIWITQKTLNPIRATQCQNFTDSLTLTSTISRFEVIGIYE